MAAQSALERGASLRIFMDELAVVEQQVSDAAVVSNLPALQLHRWRRSNIEPPTLYHTLVGDDANTPDNVKIKDTFTLQTRIAVAIGDEGYESDWLLEGYMDVYRDVTDPQLHEVGRPLNGAATFVNRTNMRTMLDTFNDVPYLAAEFVHTLQLNRFLVAT